MPKPDSLLSRARRTLARKIDVMPDPGEAWCMDCELNDGTTQILPADSARSHLDKHAEKMHNGEVASHHVYILTTNTESPM